MLDLGELAARVHIDDRAVPGELAQVHHRFGRFSSRIQSDAKVAGEQAGSKLGDGFKRESSRGLSKFSLAPAMHAITRFGAAGVLALGAVGGAGVGMGIKVAAANENATIAFTTMLKSGVKARKFLDDLKAFAAATPFEFGELQTAASSLISAGVNAKNVIPIMTSLGNATSGMGTGAEGVKRATVALQQMNAAGRIQAQDLNQLRDAGIPVYDLLSKATGKSKKEISALAQTGKLGKKELTQMMDALASGKGLERFNGLMDKQSHSLAGMWSTVKDNLGQGLASAVGPVIPLLKDGMGGAAVLIQRALAGIPKPLGMVITGLEKLWRQVKVREAAALRGALRSISDSMTILVPGLTRGHATMTVMARILPILGGAAHLAVRGMHAFSVALAWVADHKGAITGALAPIGRAIMGVVDQIRNLDPSVLRGAMQAVANAIGQIGPYVQNLLTSLPALQPTLKDTGTVLQAVASHADLVGKALPFLIAGFAAYKAAQAANNLVGRESLLGFGLQLASSVTLTASNFALARSQKAVEKSVVESNVAENVSILTRARSAIATVAVTVAQRAAAIGSKVWAAGQWLLNAALTANPIGIVVAAIALLVGALIFAYKHSARFREIVQSVFGWFRKWVPVAFAAVVAFIKDGWHKITGFFSAAAAWVKGTWSKAWRGVAGFMSGAVSKGKDAVGKLWGNVRDNFSSAKDWVAGTWRKGWAAAAPAISVAISVGRDAARRIWDSIQNKFTTVKDWVLGTFKRAWSNLKRIISDPIGAARDVVTAILGKDNHSGLRGRFWTVVDALGRIWDRLKAKMKAPISVVIGIINTGLIGAYNWVIDKLHLPGSFRANPIKIPGFRSGGSTGSGSSDDQVAGVAHANEHYFSASEVRKAGGHSRLERLRAAIRGGMQLPGYMKGGPVIWPVPGHLTGTYPGHTGVDINARGQDYGDPIRAAQGGRVTFAGFGHGYGRGIFIRTTSGYENIYGHTSAAYVKHGDWVSTGQLIGRVGSTGHSSGPHLHFEVRPGGTFAAAMRFLRGALPNPGGGGSSGGVSTVIEKAGWLGKFLNPAAFLRDKASALMAKAGLTGLSGNGWEGAIKAVPGRLLGGILGKVKGFASGLWHTARSILRGILGSDVPSGGGGSNPSRGRGMMLAAGFPPSEWPSLFQLWQHESGWRTTARNPSSGAYGIPQAWPADKMRSAGSDYRTNPEPQIRWGLSYIRDAYGTPTNAWQKWLSRSPHWYGTGTPSAMSGFNWAGDKGAELVLSPQLRQFSGGETVMSNKDTVAALSGGDKQPYIGTLTLVSSGNVHDDLGEVAFQLRRMTRGGVHA